MCGSCFQGMMRGAAVVALLAVAAAPAAGGRDTAAVEAAASAAGTLGGRPLRVAVVSLPLRGHWNPLRAVADELAARGHLVTAYLHEDCSDWVEGSPIRFESLGEQSVFNPDFWMTVTMREPLESIIPLAKRIQAAHAGMLPVLLERFRGLNSTGDLPDVVLGDFSTYAAFGAAEHFAIPAVALWCLTLSLVVDGLPFVPAQSTDLPGEMSALERTINFVVQRFGQQFAHQLLGEVNAVRSANGVAPVGGVFELFHWTRTVITPAVWGFDVTQPLCPNWKPVGPLVPAAERAGAELEPELADWVASPRCAAGVVYVNMGSLVGMRTGEIGALLEAARLLAAPPSGPCVLWKLKAAAAEFQRVQGELEGAAPGRTYVSRWLRSPSAVLRHPRTRVFVTHCGDTSVGEAMLAGVPLVGIAFFCDQVNVCARVRDSGMGAVVARAKEGGFVHLRGESIAAAVGGVLADGRYAAAARRARLLAAQMGGPPAAANAVEAAVALGSDHLVCPFARQSFRQYLALDVHLRFWLFAVLLPLACSGACCSCFCGPPGAKVFYWLVLPMALCIAYAFVDPSVVPHLQPLWPSPFGEDQFR
eukprot:TRINITY_DN21863_c0_g1_i1.p1 TRINITY_DN21863_c0_g1~~TRINITY_DN21863_c0_g1_i1.p1  ORF type:complete len:590 (+),score=190.93 TRINITY_DN21863_c0_g1_i1:54-1823(+)